MTGTLQPLDQKFALVDAQGRPTEYFTRWAQQKQIDIGDSITLADLQAFLTAHKIAAGHGIILTPDGDLNDSPNISVANGLGLNFDTMGNLKIADTAVVPGTYGDATHVPAIVVDQQGRITGVTLVAISGGGGSGSGSSPRASYGAHGAATSGNTSVTYQALILAEASLISYYPLNDALGATTAVDHKGANNAAVAKPFAFGMAGRIGDTCAFAPFGAPGSAIRGCARIPTRIIGDDFTIELWMLATDMIFNGGAQLTGTSWFSGAMLWGQDASGVTNDFGACIALNGDIYAGTGNPDVTLASPAAKNIFDGQWHHIAFTRVKATGAIILYIDGVSAVTGVGGVQSLTTLTSIQFASGPGFVADYAFYNTALSAAAVLAHYNGGKP